MGLAEKKCVPCRGGVSPFPEEEAQAFLEETPGWTIAGGAAKIERTFRFKDFASAMDFARKIGDLAELEGHHPDISVGWGYCTVSFHTHKIRGLHENDFVMAAKVNALAGE
ncbi:MAG: 4a-hydroxytetrahydrobiopterin dehydratase [Deltaproteobacteria bacterium]|nr:4a-hydroxytetrahydrobiopterin dehydratase [Deltaproteobacteria bacterium]